MMAEQIPQQPADPEESRKSKIEELKESIRVAEKNNNEDEVLALEAELRVVEEGRVFDRGRFLLDTARAKNRHRPSVLRDMLNLARKSPDSVWTWDGPSYLGPSYDITFSHLLEKFKVSSLQELVDKMPEKAKILDLFGGAYFIEDLTNVSSITGVRLENIDDQLLSESRHLDEARLITDPRRNIIEGDLYKRETWNKIKKDNEAHGGGGFDLIACRPGGPFGRKTTRATIRDVRDEGVVREEIFISLLNRAADLLSDDGGVLFTEIPNLNTPPDVLTTFWTNYMEEMRKKGYEFIFDEDASTYPEGSFALIRHKIPSNKES